MLLQKRKQILNKGIRFPLRQRFLTVLPQFPAVGVFIECQGQLPVGDISARAEEGCGVGAAFVLAENKISVCGAADAGGAGNHVHWVLVVHLSQMMDEQQSNSMAVSQLFENFQIPIVAGVRVSIFHGIAGTRWRVSMTTSTVSGCSARKDSICSSKPSWSFSDRMEKKRFPGASSVRSSRRFWIRA